ncbi:hypothetical protein MHTCC0001_16970 [Flavobacteriaceae bacterium MHTCC 0001]
MNIEQLKLILKNKSVTDLKSIIYMLYTNVPEAKDYIDIIAPFDKKAVKQNSEQLFKRYQKQFREYLLPDILEMNTREFEAFKLLERIRKKNISPQFTVDCELQFITYCKEFILTYGYFDEDYYITMDEVFESACIKIKENRLYEDYRDDIEKLIVFGNEYGFEFSEICKELNIYQTLL